MHQEHVSLVWNRVTHLTGLLGAILQTVVMEVERVYRSIEDAGEREDLFLSFLLWSKQGLFRIQTN